MHLKLHFPLVIATLLCASVVQAKTAAEVFKKVSSSVVIIMTYDAKGKSLMLGSGVVWEDGVVATNCHVLKNSFRIQVVSQDIKYSAIPMQSDWERDICSLAVKEFKGQAVTKGSTNRLQVGQKVYAVGAPQGLELTLSDGLISNLRPVEGGQYLQISAPISPGSSGGGLFDEEGRLIGLPTFYLTEGQLLNFAVPVEWINELPKRSAPAPKVGKTTSNEWVNNFIDLMNKNDWPGLLKHALLWTKAQPGEVIAWANLGMAYKMSGQTAKAIDAYQQAIRIKPDFAEAWFGLGNTYVEIKQAAKAINAYQQSIHIKPDDAEAWYNLGVCLHESGQLTEAIEAYQQVVHFKPDFVQAWYNLGASYIDTKQYAKAIEAYQQAIRITPDYADAWYNLGIAYKNSGQTGKVTEVYNRLNALNKNMAVDFFNNVVSTQGQP